MAATLTTNNPLGINYETGYFSAPVTPIAQDFFNAAFAGRVHADPIFRESYNCNMVQQCTMSTWMDEYMGYETSCYPDYNLIETNGQYLYITVKTTVTVAAYPATTVIALANASQYVNGAYVLPQVGNTVVLAPLGELAKITAVTHATSYDTTITVQLLNTAAAGQIQTAGDHLLVLSGSLIADCACPVGQFRFDDLPIIHALSMMTIGDKGSLCGDALNKCQFLKIPFTDECGNKIEKWYTQALQRMYRDFEMSKHYQRLLNPDWGIIPTLKARAMKFTPASSSEITTDDVRAWKAAMDLNGVACREYAVFAGGVLFSQWQRMLLAAGIAKLDNSLQPVRDCKWIDMQYCGISVEGLTLHIYEDCSFSNGRILGGAHMVFPTSAIFVPMCDRRTNCRGGNDQKMFTTVYFKDLSGRVWDNLTDSNGILGVRNTFGTGCETQEWTIKSRFTQEIHCVGDWGYMGLS